MKITEIQTDKVYIDILSLNDFPELKKYLQDDEVMYFFDHGPLSEEGIKKLIDTKDKVYGIYDKKTQKLIGHFVYHQWFMVDTYEIGWVLNQNYHNQGIITALGKAFLEYAFKHEHAHRIIATCQPENKASKRVCEKMNMRLEGHFKKCIYVKRKDEWWDELFYAIIDDEYFSN